MTADSMVLLGQSAQQFYPFPREFFASDEDWRAFQALVRERAPQSRDGGGRLLRTFLLWTAIFVIVILLWATFR